MIRREKRERSPASEAAGRVVEVYGEAMRKALPPGWQVFIDVCDAETVCTSRAKFALKLLGKVPNARTS